MYPYNTFNPYATQNPYNATQMPQSATQVVRVNGEGGARAYQMPANSSVLLLDENQPIVWLKTTDGAGYPQITPYRIEPFTPDPEPDLKGIEERIKRLEEIVNGKSNSRKTEHKSD